MRRSDIIVAVMLMKQGYCPKLQPRMLTKKLEPWIMRVYENLSELINILEHNLMVGLYLSQDDDCDIMYEVVIEGIESGSFNYLQL